MNAARRNNVIGKNTASQRILDSNLQARTRYCLRKVSGAFQTTWHIETVHATSRQGVQIVFRKEKKHSGTALVEAQSRDDYWPANGCPRILKAVARFGDRHSHTIYYGYVFVVKEFVGRQHFVTPEMVRGAMILIRSILDGHIHLPTGARSRLSSVVGHQYFHFANGIHVRRKVTTGSRRPAILADNTVQSNYKLSALAAVHQVIFRIEPAGHVVC